MSRDSARTLLEHLRNRGVRLELRGETIHVDAPRGVISAQHREALRSLKPVIRQRLDAETRLESMSFEEFGRSGTTVEIAVPWMKPHLWLVPTTQHAEQLVREGVKRGAIWTAAELADLYALERLGPNDRQDVALLRAHFNIRIVAIKPWTDDDEAARHPLGTS